jgi:uncharacterized protein (TIGR01655 family)
VIILKKLIIVSILLVAIVGGWFIYNEVKFEKCYVKITENAKEEDGWYVYNLKAYDKKGNEAPVKFGANKNLRLNAYLCVDVWKPLKNTANEINKYKEVTAEQLPEKVKEKLNVKQ